MNYENKPILPFISPYSVTVLKAGVYKKKNARFYGPSLLSSEDKKGPKQAAMLGYYEIPYNMIIVPKEVNNTIKDKTKIALFTLLDYSREPKLVSSRIFLSPGTPEYSQAYANYRNFTSEL